MMRHRQVQRAGLSRRHLLVGGAAALATSTLPILPTRQVARAQENQVIMTTGGGAWEAAQKIAYYDPFTEETGIEVVLVPEPELAQIRAMVETGNTTFDVSCGLDAGTVMTMGQEGLLTPIDYSFFSEEELAGMFEGGADENGVASLLYSVIMGHRTEGDTSPTTWAEFWDLGAFEGPRTMGIGSYSACGTWEIALLADGVAMEDLYPIDFDRALASLDRVRDDVVTWWDVGGIPAQLLTDGQVNLVSAWNGRIQALVDEGQDVAINWNQGMLQWDLMYVPKGAPNAENAMKLLAYMSEAKRQAVFAENIAYAPSNSKAYEFIPAERAAILPTSPDLEKLQFRQDFAFWNSTDEASGESMVNIAAQRWNEWLMG